VKISMAPTIGCWIALGMAWHLDSGIDVLIDSLLGWIYVGFKIAQYIWP
jgi:hypothetical protein